MKRWTLAIVAAAVIAVVSVIVIIRRSGERADDAERAQLKESAGPFTGPEAARRWNELRRQIVVRNGRSAIVDLPEGVALLIPHMEVLWTDDGPLSATLRATAVYSPSGDFAADGEVVFDGEVPEDFVVPIKQWEVQVGPNDDEAASVSRVTFDLTDIHLMPFDRTDWKNVKLTETAAGSWRPDADASSSQ